MRLSQSLYYIKKIKAELNLANMFCVLAFRSLYPTEFFLNSVLIVTNLFKCVCVRMQVENLFWHKTFVHIYHSLVWHIMCMRTRCVVFNVNFLDSFTYCMNFFFSFFPCIDVYFGHRKHQHKFKSTLVSMLLLSGLARICRYADNRDKTLL